MCIVADMYALGTEVPEHRPTPLLVYLEDIIKAARERQRRRIEHGKKIEPGRSGGAPPSPGAVVRPVGRQS